MKRRIITLVLSLALVVASALPAAADPTAPTNGGSANGNGASGQCTGDQASRPPSCHNDLGSGN